VSREHARARHGNAGISENHDLVAMRAGQVDDLADSRVEAFSRRAFTCAAFQRFVAADPLRWNLFRLRRTGLSFASNFPAAVRNSRPFRQKQRCVA